MNLQHTEHRHTSLESLRIGHPNWVNPRSFTGLDKKSIADLAEDMTNRGILVPLDVVRVYFEEAGKRDIRFLVLEGQRRYTAAHQVWTPDDEVIPVADHTPHDVEAIELDWKTSDKFLLDFLSVGTRRESLSSYELAEVAERLRNRDEGKGKMLEIANAIGRSESWVSKFLKARKTASPKLLEDWKLGKVTDEQFKDLASVKLEEQREALADVIDAKNSGDKAEARVKAKEIAARAKAATPKKPTKAEKKAVKLAAREAKKKAKEDAKAAKKKGKDKAPANDDGQEDLFSKKAKAVEPEPAPAPKVAKPLSRAAIEEFAAIGESKPPTHEYVQGLMDGARYILGTMDINDFRKPWHVYLARVGGVTIGEQRKAKKAKGGAKPKRAASKREAPAARKKTAKKMKPKKK